MIQLFEPARRLSKWFQRPALPEETIGRQVIRRKAKGATRSLCVSPKFRPLFAASHFPHSPLCLCSPSSALCWLTQANLERAGERGRPNSGSAFARFCRLKSLTHSPLRLSPCLSVCHFGLFLHTGSTDSSSSPRQNQSIGRPLRSYSYSPLTCPFPVSTLSLVLPRLPHCSRTPSIVIGLHRLRRYLYIVTPTFSHLTTILSDLGSTITHLMHS